MSNFLNTIKYLAGGLGAIVGSFLGGIDKLIITLAVFMVVDYTTGVISAYIEKKIDSKVGALGIARKIIIFLLVGLSSMLDANMLNGQAVIRTAVIFFYIANEGISIIENASRLGLPISENFKNALATIKDNDKGRI